MNAGSRTLILTVFVAGAIVLVLEIIGTRLLSPYFGSNLYVWSALISVTLLSLAIGYWLGGRVADRSGSDETLDRVILLAGVLTAATPPTVRFTAELMGQLNVAVAILASAVVCFAPALCALGMITPIAVRLSTRDLSHVGRSVGSIYGFSTAGSIFGALATGFLLLPNYSVSRICYAAAAVLLSLAAGRNLARRIAAPWAAVVAALGIVPAVAVMKGPANQVPRDDGGIRVLLEQPSYYGLVEVVESSGYRYMLVDGSLQTMQIADGNRPAFPYLWIFSAMPHLRPGADRLLLIGLGGGDLVQVFGRYGISATAVEIDRAVANAALQHFGIRQGNLELIIDDGRNYLRRLEGQPFDFVVLDAYAGGSPPTHLFSVEAFRQMKAALRPGGILGVNVIVHGLQDTLIADLTRTMKHVFGRIRGFTTEPGSTRPVNVVLMASDEMFEMPESSIVTPYAEAHRDYLLNLSALEIPLEDLDGTILSDEFNPMEVRVASTELEVKKATRAMFNALRLANLGQ